MCLPAPGSIQNPLYINVIAPSSFRSPHVLCRPVVGGFLEQKPAGGRESSYLQTPGPLHPQLTCYWPFATSSKVLLLSSCWLVRHLLQVAPVQACCSLQAPVSFQVPGWLFALQPQFSDGFKKSQALGVFPAFFLSVWRGHSVQLSTAPSRGWFRSVLSKESTSLFQKYQHTGPRFKTQVDKCPGLCRRVLIKSDH